MVVNFRLAQPLFTGSGLFDRDFLLCCGVIKSNMVFWYVVYMGERGNSIEIEDQIKNIQSRA